MNSIPLFFRPPHSGPAPPPGSNGRVSLVQADPQLSDDAARLHAKRLAQQQVLKGSVEGLFIYIYIYL
jgi:hypothetical protein